MASSVDVIVETAGRRTFVSALDWPGLSRCAKNEDLAVQAFLAASGRYRFVAERAGEMFPAGSLAASHAGRVTSVARTGCLDSTRPGSPGRGCRTVNQTTSRGSRP